MIRKSKNETGFTKRYIFALSLVALFSILAYFNLSHLIKAQTQDGEVINVSGRQRMLSQKIALFSLQYNIDSSKDIQKELSKNIDLMKKSHKWLISIEKSNQVYEIYFSKPHFLNNQVKNYIEKAQTFLAKKDKESLEYIIRNSQFKRCDEALYLAKRSGRNRIRAVL